MKHEALSPNQDPFVQALIILARRGRAIRMAQQQIPLTDASVEPVTITSTGLANAQSDDTFTGGAE